MPSPSSTSRTWRHNDSAFPPLVPGVTTKSVYERAGFEVNKGNSNPAASKYAESIRSSHSSTRKKKKSPSSASSRSNSIISNVGSRSNTPESYIPLRGSRSASTLSARGAASAAIQPTIHEETDDHMLQEELSTVPSRQTYTPIQSKAQVYPSSEKPGVTVTPPMQQNQELQSRDNDSCSNNETTTPSEPKTPRMGRDRSYSETSSVYSNDPVQDRTPSTNYPKPFPTHQQLSNSQLPSLEETLDRAQQQAAITSPTSSSKNLKSLMLNIKPPLAQPIAKYQPPSPRPLDLSPTTTQAPTFPTPYSKENSLARAMTPNSHKQWEDSVISAGIPSDQQHSRTASSTSSSGISRDSNNNSPITPAEPNGLSAAPFYNDGLKNYGGVPPQPVKKRKPKGPCRGCGQKITGKSVYSSDGSLSGRWHKSCFCCAECKSFDFQRGAGPGVVRNAEFYIFADRPLCHACFHTSNNSMCPTCGVGIEGECVSDGQNKFHLACLRCGVCDQVLDVTDGGYVTVIGGVLYCPQHSEIHIKRQTLEMNGGALGQEGTTTTRVEKRRTRLLMM